MIKPAHKTVGFVFLQLLVLAGLVVLPALACNIPGSATGTPSASETPTSTPTATPIAVPAGWICYQNATYAFEYCYPPDATLTADVAEHARIDLTFASGTSLAEKWMDVDALTGPSTCGSPQAQGYEPGAIATETRTINGLEFTVQSASQGAAGNFYLWTGYSTQRGDVCISLTGTLHSLNPGNFPVPPPEYDQAAESAVFDSIVATFRWLD
jgi:hypothetical protein